MITFNEDINKYWHKFTGFILKSKTEKVVTGKYKDGKILDLTLEDIEKCNDMGFNVVSPDQLQKTNRMYRAESGWISVEIGYIWFYREIREKIIKFVGEKANINQIVEKLWSSMHCDCKKIYERFESGIYKYYYVQDIPENIDTQLTKTFLNYYDCHYIENYYTSEYINRLLKRWGDLDEDEKERYEDQDFWKKYDEGYIYFFNEFESIIKRDVGKNVHMNSVMKILWEKINMFEKELCIGKENEEKLHLVKSYDEEYYEINKEYFLKSKVNRNIKIINCKVDHKLTEKFLDFCNKNWVEGSWVCRMIELWKELLKVK